MRDVARLRVSAPGIVTPRTVLLVELPLRAAGGRDPADDAPAQPTTSPAGRARWRRTSTHVPTATATTIRNGSA
jgi:hypothetical protein